MDKKQTPKVALGHRMASSDAFLSVVASLYCVLLGLLLGVLVLAIVNYEHAIGDGLMVILESGVKSARNMGTVLANGAPLIMTGLSVGFAFKTGLFNIGVAGQYTLGAFGALYCAIVLKWPWALCLLAAMVLGALWGAIPGIFKAYMGINEVITSIMFNWIGLYLVNDLIFGRGSGAMYDMTATKTYNLRKAAPQATIPDLGMSGVFGGLQSVTIAIFIAFFFAIAVHIMLHKTTFGYEMKACGLNKNAAQYAGINDRRSIVLSMTIAGALAGLGAGLCYLSTVAQWNPQISTALPAMGFNGISAALIACASPIGTIGSSLFISYITVGGSKLSTQYFTREIADVITALIIYLCSFLTLFKGRIRAALTGKKPAKKGGAM